ncbi:glycosyltransferase [Rhodococcus sp. NPDC077669]|uniref:glycosyltransferase n=1 Tax=Rhodococcus sp. NPDC077669 TaxID=3155174 RepID=UPI00344302C7
MKEDRRMDPLTLDDIQVVAAVNDTRVLDFCLRRSPAIASGEVPLEIIQGCRRPAEAFNPRLQNASYKVLIFIHQDVYLPAPFFTRLLGQLNNLADDDPEWAVIGAVGIDSENKIYGQAWSSGSGKVVGVSCSGHHKVESLDEVLLAVRVASGVQFDDNFPGFHLYGTDLVQTAQRRGLNSYAVPMQIVHHSKRLANLAGSYRQTYKYCRRKWSNELPVPTLFGGINRTPIALLRADRFVRRNNDWKKDRPEPTGDPKQIAIQLGYEDATEDDKGHQPKSIQTQSAQRPRTQ